MRFTFNEAFHLDLSPFCMRILDRLQAESSSVTRRTSQKHEFWEVRNLGSKLKKEATTERVVPKSHPPGLVCVFHCKRTWWKIRSMRLKQLRDVCDCLVPGWKWVGFNTTYVRRAWEAHWCYSLDDRLDVHQRSRNWGFASPNLGSVVTVLIVKVNGLKMETWHTYNVHGWWVQWEIFKSLGHIFER